MSWIAMVRVGGEAGGADGVQVSLLVVLSATRVPFCFLYVVAAVDAMVEDSQSAKSQCGRVQRATLDGTCIYETIVLIGRSEGQIHVGRWGFHVCAPCRHAAAITVGRASTRGSLQYVGERGKEGEGEGEGEAGL